MLLIHILDKVMLVGGIMTSNNAFSQGGRFYLLVEKGQSPHNLGLIRDLAYD